MIVERVELYKLRKITKIVCNACLLNEYVEGSIDAGILITKVIRVPA